MLGVIALWFILLATLRPEEPSLRSFALAATANAAGLLATSHIISVQGAALVATARSWQLASLGALAVLIPGLLSTLAHRRFTRWPSWIVGTTFFILGASGLFVDPLSRQAHPPLTGAGLAAVIVLALAMTPLTLQFASAAIHDRRLRFLALSLLAILVGGAFDLADLAVGRAPAEFAVHAIGVTTIALAATLMRRVVEGEAELEKSSALLASSLDELARAEALLDETRRRAAIGEVAAVVAHEVRNPLAVLRNAASSLRKRTTTSEDAETLLGILQEETHRLGELGRSLAHFAVPMSHHPALVQLDALIDAVVASARRAHGEGPALRFEVRAEPICVFADEELLRRALLNIVDNAIRAMPEGGPIRIRATSDGARARIEVEDEGEGMSDEVRERATDPFFTTRATGTGLGLALVDKIVRTHGGEVVIGGAEPRGARVGFVLPAAKPLRSGEAPSR